MIDISYIIVSNKRGDIYYINNVRDNNKMQFESMEESRDSGYLKEKHSTRLITNGLGDDTILDVCISYDNRHIITATTNRYVMIYDIHTLGIVSSVLLDHQIVSLCASRKANLILVFHPHGMYYAGIPVDAGDRHNVNIRPLNTNMKEEIVQGLLSPIDNTILVVARNDGVYNVILFSLELPPVSLATTSHHICNVATLLHEPSLIDFTIDGAFIMVYSPESAPVFFDVSERKAVEDMGGAGDVGVEWYGQGIMASERVEGMRKTIEDENKVTCIVKVNEKTIAVGDQRGTVG